MKIYSIPTPDKLREIAESVKWNKDYRTVMSFANHWDRSSKNIKVTLEFGKSAAIYREEDGVRTPMATIYTAAARDIVKELTEV